MTTSGQKGPAGPAAAQRSCGCCSLHALLLLPCASRCVARPTRRALRSPPYSSVANCSPCFTHQPHCQSTGHRVYRPMAAALCPGLHRVARKGSEHAPCVPAPGSVADARSARLCCPVCGRHALDGGSTLWLVPCSLGGPWRLSEGQGAYTCCDARSAAAALSFSTPTGILERTFAGRTPGTQINVLAIYRNALPPSYRAWGALYTIPKSTNHSCMIGRSGGKGV